MAGIDFGKLLLDRERAFLEWLHAPAQAHRLQRNGALVQAIDGLVGDAVPALRRLAGMPSAGWWDKHNLGAALLLAGDYAAAAKWLRRAKADGSDDDRTAFALAVAHMLAGEPDAAALVKGSGEQAGKRTRLLKGAYEAGALASPAAQGGVTLQYLTDALAGFAKSAGLKLDIAYLAVHTGVTGGAKIFFEQANWLTSLGHNVLVTSFGSPPKWFPLKAAFRQVSPDALLSEETAGADVVVGTFWAQNHDLMRSSPRATRVFFAQGDQYVWEPESFDDSTRNAVALSHRVPAAILTVSEALGARLQEIYGREAKVVPNGIDLEVFKPLSKAESRAFRILAVGRDSLAFKGLQDVFEAVRIVRQRGLDCQLTWVSPGDPVTAGVDCTFYKSPSQSELARLYAEADVFVSGSRHESFSLPCLEAMACGTAVVTVANEGVLTYARDNENCLLTPPADPEVLAEAILRLAHDAQLRNRLVEGGLRTAETYGWPSVADRLEQQLLRFWLEDLFVLDDPGSLPSERISLCMIVRDEGEHLGRCLDSVKDLVDEMLIVDTGSEDNTREIAKSRGAKVYDFEWRDDFSEARNHSIDRARGDWILWLDGDEELQAGNRDSLQRLLRANVGAEAITLPIESLMDDADPSSRIIHGSPRLFRNRRHYRFEGSIHEQIQGSIEGVGGRLLPGFTPILHYGYLQSVRDAKHKEERNAALLQKQIEQNPEDSFAHFNLATEHFVRGEYETALTMYQRAYQTAKPEARNAQYFSKLLRNLAHCHRLLGNPVAASQVLDEALALYPDYTDLWLQKGQIYEQQGKWEPALEAFDHCLKLGEAPSRYLSSEGSGTWVPWYHKGAVLERQGQLVEAVHSFARSIEFQPTYREPAVRLAHLVARPDSPAELVAAVEGALERSPFRDEVLAQSHYYGHRFARAGEFAERVKITGLIALARAAGYLAAGDAHKTLAVLEGTVLSTAETVDAIKFSIISAWLDLRWDDAVGLSQRLAGLNPPAGTAYASLTAVLRNRVVVGTTSQRTVETSQGAGAAGRQPTPSELRSALELLIDLGQYELFESALAVFDAHPTPGWKTEVGKLLFRKGFADLAFDLIAADGERAKQDEEALSILGDVALGKGYFSEAEAFFKRAMSLANRPELYMPRLAVALLRGGKAGEAAELLSRLATAGR